MSRVVLHIDEMVLRGMSRAQGDQIAAALESQLREKLVGRGGAELLASLASGTRTVPGRATRIDADAAPAKVGGALASHILGGTKP